MSSSVEVVSDGLLHNLWHICYFIGWRFDVLFEGIASSAAKNLYVSLG